MVTNTYLSPLPFFHSPLSTLLPISVFSLSFTHVITDIFTFLPLLSFLYFPSQRPTLFLQVLEVEARNLILDCTVLHATRSIRKEFRIAHPPLFPCEKETCGECFISERALREHLLDQAGHRVKDKEHADLLTKFLPVERSHLSSFPLFPIPYPLSPSLTSHPSPLSAGLLRAPMVASCMRTECFSTMSWGLLRGECSPPRTSPSVLTSLIQGGGERGS